LPPLIGSYFSPGIAGFFLKYGKWTDITIITLILTLLLIIGFICGTFGEKMRCRIKRGATIWEAVTGNHVNIIREKTKERMRAKLAAHRGPRTALLVEDSDDEGSVASSVGEDVEAQYQVMLEREPSEQTPLVHSTPSAPSRGASGRYRAAEAALPSVAEYEEFPAPSARPRPKKKTMYQKVKRIFTSGGSKKDGKP
jgi:hypothetical protein